MIIINIIIIHNYGKWKNTNNNDDEENLAVFLKNNFRPFRNFRSY